MTESAIIIPLKQKTLPLTRLEALKGLIYLKWGITSPSELSLLSELINYSGDASIHIDQSLRVQISKATAIPIKSISTAIGRLVKSGCVIKQGKNIYVHPVFKGWDSLNQILFKIQV